eukprot:COSAG02_NODE_17678_length_988_cov_0.922385_1_plen_90_part_00
MQNAPPSPIGPIALRVRVGSTCAGRTEIHGTTVEETPDRPLITEAAILYTAKAWLQSCLGLVTDIEIQNGAVTLLRGVLYSALTSADKT